MQCAVDDFSVADEECILLHWYRYVEGNIDFQCDFFFKSPLMMLIMC